MFFTVKHPSKPPSLNDSGLRSIQKFIRVSSWNENIVDTGLGRLTPNFGAGARTRTLDIRFWRPTLYQLSYTYKLERVSRFELPTFCLASRRSTPELHPHNAGPLCSYHGTRLYKISFWLPSSRAAISLQQAFRRSTRYPIVYIVLDTQIHSPQPLSTRDTRHSRLAFFVRSKTSY